MTLLHNHLLINAAIAWAAAQILKTIIYAIMNKTLEPERLLGSGGMPSSHSATVTALAATSALEYGLGSEVFAITAILAFVVMYDAIGVRREAGKHAKAINILQELLGPLFEASDLEPEDQLKEFLGHTPSQVLCGVLLGLVIAFILG